eukprot:NODE_4565_length_1875_cov_6.230549.p1 GENE.NODE_4565_length_1875_cov_6.230549~~NODE_4565_length_1875_cov_6.230549.p1  ORF type:complete len:518 (+),score=123.56 NODE_4565_length_1875_cov_6.230549:143-1696(+)
MPGHLEVPHTHLAGFLVVCAVIVVHAQLDGMSPILFLLYLFCCFMALCCGLVCLCDGDPPPRPPDGGLDTAQEELRTLRAQLAEARDEMRVLSARAAQMEDRSGALRPQPGEAAEAERMGRVDAGFEGVVMGAADERECRVDAAPDASALGAAAAERPEGDGQHGNVPFRDALAKADPAHSVKGAVVKVDGVAPRAEMLALHTDMEAQNPRAAEKEALQVQIEALRVRAAEAEALRVETEACHVGECAAIHTEMEEQRVQARVEMEALRERATEAEALRVESEKQCVREDALRVEVEVLRAEQAAEAREAEAQRAESAALRGKLEAVAHSRMSPPPKEYTTVGHHWYGDLECHVMDTEAGDTNTTRVRVITVLCSDLLHHEVTGDIRFNGVEVTIRRAARLPLPALEWTKLFEFEATDGIFEFRTDEAKLERGCLTLIFRATPMEQRTFRFPPHFSMEDTDVEMTYSMELSEPSVQSAQEAAPHPLPRHRTSDSAPAERPAGASASAGSTLGAGDDF